jgi:hypothetical protein
MVPMIAAECAKRKLRLIINAHLRDTVPEGVEGAQLGLSIIITHLQSQPIHKKTLL